jgi:hypothetical protein
MKSENEFINLRLYSLDQALGIIDCLFDNGYSYRNYSQEKSIREKVRQDITNVFGVKDRAEKMKFYVVFYIEIDNEIKDFVITTKNIDIVDARGDKIKKIINELLGTK